MVEGGTFGPGLIAHILDQYHQALQVTEPLLSSSNPLEYGIDISTGQLHRILTENKDHFHQEKAVVLAAGLAESSYIGTDDTGRSPSRPERLLHRWATIGLLISKPPTAKIGSTFCRSCKGANAPM